MKSFACAHGEIQNKFWMKSKPVVSVKLSPSPNPTKSDFITQVILSIEDGFHPSKRTDLVEKDLVFRQGLFLSMGYKKIFLLFLRINSNSRK